MFYISVHCHCLQTHQKTALDPITNGCEPPRDCWELNSWPLKEQSVFLTPEISLQPMSLFFMLWAPESFISGPQAPIPAQHLSLLFTCIHLRLCSLTLYSLSLRIISDRSASSLASNDINLGESWKTEHTVTLKLGTIISVHSLFLQRKRSFLGW